MRPDSEDSTPKRHMLCLSPYLRLFKLYPLFFLFFSFSCIALKSFKCDSFTQFWRVMCADYTRGLLLQKLIIICRASSSTHICPFLICTFSSPLYAPLWLKFLPSWVAWLLCLCPMFPFVRLGHKGSTSVIVTQPGYPDMYLRRVKPKSSVLKRISAADKRRTALAAI